MTQKHLGMGTEIDMTIYRSGTVDNYKNSLGKTIKALELVDNQLLFTFDDDSKIRVFDDGQDCCETRYMSTDDNMADHLGAKLERIEIKDAPDIIDDNEVHAVQFLEVTTSNGCLTLANHNEHNGVMAVSGLRLRGWSR